jgi:hypothetical protein
VIECSQVVEGSAAGELGVRLLRRWPMQKVVIFGALTALFFLFTPATRAQNANEVERLRRENELLKKENELLKKEIELLKKEAKAKPDGAGCPKTGAKSQTKASRGGIDFELVKCVRDHSKPTRVTFTFSAQCDAENRNIGGDGFRQFYLTLTARGGETLEGKVKGSRSVVLTKGVASKFQLSYEEVDKDITEFDDVELGETNFGREVKFYNIKIEAK